jgi:broad specificity phosphatase PhoE
VSALVLIRHGQAMAFSDDPDRLSALGEDQSARLGEWWRRHGISFDEAWCGTLARQRRTAERAGYPNASADAAWNEYDAAGILEKLGPELKRRDADFRALADAYEAARGSASQNRHFQRMFEALIRGWTSGELAADGVESWREFHGRVEKALRAILAGQGSRRVAVFTSGGVIGTAAQVVLNAPEAAAIELNWRIRNASLTEFVFTQNRVSLDCFNALPHLEDPGRWTFR